MKKKIDPEELEKDHWWKKLMKSQPFASDGLLQLVSSYWHDKLALPKFDVSIGSKQLFRYVFMEKYSSWFVIPF